MTHNAAYKKTEKYLRSRAVLSPWRLVGCQRSDFRAAIVIPVLDEVDSLPKTLLSLEKNSPQHLAQTLVVVVVNNRVSASALQKSQNQESLQYLQSHSRSNLNLVWVDAASPGMELPEKDGVGLARKIGFDLALSRLKNIEGSLFISLDADSLVDENYLSAIFQHFQSNPCVAAYFPFRHQRGKTLELEAAIRDYELYLRSYRFGLEWAGSPYAFISIGSALACRASTYVAVGGMKRRQAGEDFYFLQQLVKTGAVSPLHGTLVMPAARYSERVPFGTGRALEAKVTEGKNLYRFISLSPFRQLKIWLEVVAVFQSREASALIEQAGTISPVLKSFLEESDFSSVWLKLQKQAAGERFIETWHHWFDGLKTRQLLTRLEQERSPTEPRLLVAELLAAGGYQNITECADQLELLERFDGVPLF